MVKKLKLRAFKSFKEMTEIPLCPLTILTGANSSGKSSIIQALTIGLNHHNGMTFDQAIPEGHGDRKELTNINSKAEDLLIDITADTESRDDSSKFEFTVVSADRYGARTFIPVTKGKNLDAKGDNLIWILDQLQNEEIPEPARFPKDDLIITLYPQVQAWLDEIAPSSKFRYELQTKADISYTLFNDFRANNVGYGLSFTLPVIVALLWSTLKKDRIVILENPEAHLHPRGQSKITELICRVVNCGAQVIVETHSDHIINGIRVNTKRFEEGLTGLDRGKVSILHIALDQETNESQLTPVKIEERGRIYDAPEDFCEQYNIDRRELLGF